MLNKNNKLTRFFIITILITFFSIISCKRPKYRLDLYFNPVCIYDNEIYNWKVFVNDKLYLDTTFAETKIDKHLFFKSIILNGTVDTSIKMIVNGMQYKSLIDLKGENIIAYFVGIKFGRRRTNYKGDAIKIDSSEKKFYFPYSKDSLEVNFQIGDPIRLQKIVPLYKVININESFE